MPTNLTVVSETNFNIGVTQTNLTGASVGVSQTNLTAASSRPVSANTITLYGNGGKLALHGSNEMVFLSGTNNNIDDLSQGMTLVLSGSPGNVTLSGFANDLSGVIDLRGGLGGFTTPQAVVSALTSDGHGGTLLSFGSAGSLDFVNTPAADLTASHFAIG